MKLEQIADDKTIEWLLEKDNPSVRYFTLTKLLNKNESDKEVLETKDNIMKIGIVPAILDKQNEAGYWGSRSEAGDVDYLGI